MDTEQTHNQVNYCLKKGQTDRRTDRHKKEDRGPSKISNTVFDNAGLPDTTYLYYSHVEGDTLKGYSCQLDKAKTKNSKARGRISTGRKTLIYI